MMSIEDIEFLERKFIRRSSTSILTQRIRRRFCSTPTFLKDDDEKIRLERQKPVNPEILKKLNLTMNYGSSEKTEVKLEEGDLEINRESISDEDFRRKCTIAKNLCKKYVYIFIFLEKFVFTVMTFCPILAVLIVEGSFKPSIEQIIIIACVFFIIIFLSSLGDWGGLREKYARLYHSFKILTNSKSDDRIKKFQSYATSFGSDDLFIDNIFLNEDVHYIIEHVQ